MSMNSLFISLILTSLENTNITAEIQTCSGWQLNRYPILKQFVRESGGADQYDMLKVKYISGHNPDLVIYNDDIEIERIDLKKYNTLKDIQNLLNSKHIYPRSSCLDSHQDCHYWSSTGECTKNKNYMEKTCKYSCNMCPKIEL